MSERVLRFLSGGVFFFLLSLATPKRPTPDERKAGNQDSHKDVVLMGDLIHVMSESYGKLNGKEVSNYLGGNAEYSAGLPFNNQTVIESMHKEMVEDYSTILKRMHSFVEKHIDESKQNWLVCALLETIDFDDDIPATHEFIIGDNVQVIEKASLLGKTDFILEHFLLAVFHFIVKYRGEKNYKGLATLEELGYNRKARSRSAAKRVGDSITAILSIKRLKFQDSSPDDAAEKQAMETYFENYEEDFRRLESLSESIRSRTPHKIAKPTEINHSIEDPFLGEVLKAFSQKEGKTFKEKADLDEDYQDELESCRDDFYDAETVRVEAIITFGDMGTLEFSDMKSEVFGIVKRTYNASHHELGYTRMQNVLARAEDTPCEKTILGRSSWVGASERRGVCHMLAGDQLLRWVVDHE